MGILTLNSFRDLLSTALGDRGISNNVLDGWINLAYIEVVTAENIEVVRETVTLRTAKGLNRYPLPHNHLGIVSTTDITHNKALLRMHPRNFKALDVHATGEPKYWTRIGNEFNVWPTPVGFYEIEIVYVQDVKLLEDPEDKSILPSAYDNAIYLYSVHYAKSAIEDTDEEALKWAQRANHYLSNRVDDSQFNMESPSAGVTVAHSFDDIVRRGHGK